MPFITVDDSAVRAPQPLPASRYAFPGVRGASRSGLVAHGGDFEPSTLVAAYRAGIFPWPHEDEDLLWFAPDPRAIILVGGLHVSRRLARRLRTGCFTASIDRAFDAVVDGCATRDEGTWITPGYRDGFRRLHEAGWAHSIEIWNRDGALAGGLYGIAIAGFFGAESMFHRVTDASKAAMVVLLDRLKARGFRLVDVQLPTEHLASMGAVTVERARYMEMLGEALAADATF